MGHSSPELMIFSCLGSDFQKKYLRKCIKLGGYKLIILRAKYLRLVNGNMNKWSYSNWNRFVDFDLNSSPWLQNVLIINSRPHRIEEGKEFRAVGIKEGGERVADVTRIITQSKGDSTVGREWTLAHGFLYGVLMQISRI